MEWNGERDEGVKEELEQGKQLQVNTQDMGKLHRLGRMQPSPISPRAAGWVGDTGAEGSCTEGCTINPSQWKLGCVSNVRTAKDLRRSALHVWRQAGDYSCHVAWLLREADTHGCSESCAYALLRCVRGTEQEERGEGYSAIHSRGRWSSSSWA